jgi:low affinity Fe/Cu permease
VFIIQNTQNRDNKAIHLKLDELITAIKGAHNSMIDLDRLSDHELKALENEYKRLCARREASGEEQPEPSPGGDKGSQVKPA